MKLMCSRIKEIIKCFCLVLNHQVISVATLIFQLSWIMFCNRYRFAPYRAQRKSKHAFQFLETWKFHVVVVQKKCAARAKLLFF